MDWVAFIVSLTVAYILGSIPTAVWVGRWFYDTDVREHGSGNAGTTNVIRVLGYKAAIPVFVIDVLKGWLAVFIIPYIFEMLKVDAVPRIMPVIAVVAVVLGHVFPLFAGFRGGKGVATLLGVGLALYPYATLSALAIFVIVLLLKNYVSLASISASISFPLFVFFLFPTANYYLYFPAVAVALFVPITHRKNIKRLIEGNENKFFKKK